MSTTETKPFPTTAGRVLHRAVQYDLLLWLLTLGRERVFRERALDLAGLSAGESVLDIGCGTGTLAIAAKRQVGREGHVHGIDASPEMIVRAGMKAKKAGLEVDFRAAVVESLPYPGGQFDVVLSTLMLHHLPGKLRTQCASEVRRVLKPGGRALIIDFGTSQGAKGLVAHFHRHAHVDLAEMSAIFSEAGLKIARSGRVGIGDMEYVLAVAPGGEPSAPIDSGPRVMKGLSGIFVGRWVLIAAAVILVGAHVLAFHLLRPRALSAAVVSGIVALVVVKHLGVFGSLYGLLRKRFQKTRPPQR